MRDVSMRLVVGGGWFDHHGYARADAMLGAPGVTEAINPQDGFRSAA